MLILDSILSWGGVVDELDIARRFVSWNENGFLELGETRGPKFKGVFGKVQLLIRISNRNDAT